MTDEGKTRLGWTATKQAAAGDCCDDLVRRNFALVKQNEDLRYALKKIVSEGEGLLLEAHRLSRKPPSDENAATALRIWSDFECAVNYARVYGLGMAARVRRLFGKNGETADGPTSDCDGADAGRVRRVPG